VVLQVVAHRLSDGEATALDAAPRVLYDLDENAADYSPESRAIDGPLRALAFELVPAGSPGALLAAELGLEVTEPRLLRCDRVDFPPGGVAYLHTHQGPGIRVLLQGAIRIETNGQEHSYGPGQAWFEPGPEPVFAAASETEPTAFVRCMVLPDRLVGQSSIRYVRDEDAGRPKPQSYTVFVDQLVEAA
jgi:quercetin dioxygenase-like cupin family protein